VGTTLAAYLANPAKLKNQLIENWGKHVKGAITDKHEVLLTGPFADYVNAFNFSIFDSRTALQVIEDHRACPCYAARFGGGLPSRPAASKPPADFAAAESRYVSQLLGAYADHKKQPVQDVKALKAWPTLERHFGRQREAFYEAESLRVFARVPSGTFESLQDDIHTGVIDVCEGDHPDGFERVKQVTKAAREVEITSNALIGSLKPKDPADLADQLQRLDTTLSQREQQLAISEAQYRDASKERATLRKKLEEGRERRAEIAALIERFSLLDQHYVSDLARLRGIEEGGTLFEVMGQARCPLCGAEPAHHQKNSDCDGNVEAVVAAARAEIAKIELLRVELTDTMKALETEASGFDRRLPRLDAELQRVALGIEQLVTPKLTQSRTAYAELADKRGEVRESSFRSTLASSRAASRKQTSKRNSTPCWRGAASVMWRSFTRPPSTPPPDMPSTPRSALPIRKMEDGGCSKTCTMAVRLMLPACARAMSSWKSTESRSNPRRWRRSVSARIRC
jgi:hypothetical protein